MAGFSLKDQLFNKAKVQYLAELLAAQVPAFSKRRFVAHVMKNLPKLELKQRITWIAQKLEDQLPTEFPAAADLIVRSLSPALDETQRDDDFGDFIIAPFGEYVVRNGLASEHLHLSLRTLKEITKRFSMEDAMRAFLRNYPEETLRELASWSRDANYHVRRLVSESTRPFLPWSVRTGLPIDTALPLLYTLHADPTRYVTRSVANHLNDIAKKNPELVIKALGEWRSLGKQNADELTWMTRHALRNLIKRGHADSLKLLGFDPEPQIRASKIRLTKSKLIPGDTLEFAFTLTASRDESLVVDYAIDFVKAGGKRSSKVFKAAKISIQRGETLTVRKCHKLLAAATTYRLYPGKHLLTIQINGQQVGSAAFTIS